MTRSARRPAALALLLLLLGSCQDRPSTPVAPPPERVVPSFALADGAHGGNPRFFFLPPLVPTRPSFGGSFDASVLSRLRVEVCALAGTSCGSTVATLSSSGSPAYARIRLDAVRQFYLVYWSSAAANVATHYRVQVWLDQTRLGFADVDVVATAGQLAGVNRSQYVGLKKGDYLPVIFRVEQGALQTNRAPTLTITAPENNASFPVGSSVTFSATATDAEDGDRSAQIAWSEGATPLGTGASISTSSLGVGAHTITATVADLAGATASASVTIQVTNRAPVVEITAPAEGSSFGVGVPITFTGVATDAESGVLSASIVWRSSVNGPLGTGASVSTSTLSAGTHKILASVADPHGAMDEDTLTVVITNSAPTVQISAPANNASFPVGSSITFTGTASDPEQGNLSGALVWREGATPLGSGASFSLSTLSVGPHTITASVTDAQGNTGSASVSIQITNRAPAVIITAPTPGQSFAAGAPVTFSATATDAESGNVAASLVWREGATTLGTGANFSLSTLGSGTHTVIATATDPHGRTGSDTVTFNIATANRPPTVTISAPTNGQSFPVLSSVTFGGTASDPEDGDLSGQIAWQVVGSGRTLGTGASLSVADLPVGRHIVRARVTDSQGASDSADVTLTITNANPTLRITAPADSARFQAGQTITFTGTATDPEQGDLSSRISWQVVNLGMTLGTGASLSTASLPAGTHTIRARVVDDHGGVATAEITVIVTSVIGAINLLDPGRIGAGLQTTFSVGGTLSVPAPAGTVVTLRSSNPAVARVGRNFGDVGVDSVTIPLSAGATQFTYFVHGVAVGDATLTATAPSYTPGSVGVVVVQAPLAFGFLSLPATLSSLGEDDPFTVQLGGVPGGNNQHVRAGAPLTVTLTVGDTAVGRLVTSAGSGQSVTVQIPAGGSSSPATVAAGGVAFDPRGNGTTLVTASAPGMHSVSQSVTVIAPGIAIQNALGTALGPVGEGLMTSARFVLGASNHGGVTVRVRSSDPSSLRVSRDFNVAGTEFIDIPVGPGATVTNFVLHGIARDTATIAVSAPGFATATAAIDVVQPEMVFHQVPGTVSPGGLDSPVSVQLRVPGQIQSVRAGGPPLTVTFASSDSTVGRLVTAGGVARSVTVQILPGQSQSPATVATGGAAFRALAPGTATLSASAPGYATISQTATVVPATIHPGLTNGAPIGVGLMDWSVYANISSTNHNGVAVRIRSSDSTVVRVGPQLGGTGGRAEVSTGVSAGFSLFQYSVHGMAPGTASLTFSAPGFRDTTVTVTVVQPVISAIFTNFSYPASAGATPVRFFITTPGAGLGQGVRAGGPPIAVQFSIDNPAVAELVSGATRGASVTVQITSGYAGYVSIDPAAPGTTTLRGNVAGSATVGTATVRVVP